MTDPFARAVAHFNAEEYREALLALEERWVVERGDFLRGLIQLCNAMNQLRLGLVTSPRRLLGSADALLAPYAPRYEGLDVTALRRATSSVRACIPDWLESEAGRIAWDSVPRPQLVVEEH